MTHLTTQHWFSLAAQQIQKNTRTLPTPSPSALELDPAQDRARQRLVQITQRHGGALLADITGLGKTRTACATALTLLSRWPQGATLLCCLPARQIERWKATWAKVNLGLHHILFCSHTALSRGWLPPHHVDLVLVDEAHHFRHRHTKRHQQLAKIIAQGALTLLVTATPICNSTKDLHTLLRLFLGESDTLTVTGCTLREAFEKESTLLELIAATMVRREWLEDSSSLSTRPNLKLHTLLYNPGPQEEDLWLTLEGTLRKLTLNALAQTWPAHLFRQFLLKRWESGLDALRQSLAALVLWHQKTLAHLHTPHKVPRPSPQEFTASAPSTLLQESLFLPAQTPETPSALDPQEITHDLQILQTLLTHVQRCAKEGCGRTKAIIKLVQTHPHDKFLLFTSHVDAATALFLDLTRTLGPSAQVGCITGQGASATGLGRTTPFDVMRRFAPLAQECLDPLPDHQHLRILIATDCLSEGVNLQDCSRVVLVDLPYSTLQIEQRIGRLVRPGNPQDTVLVTIPRPRSWPDSLGMRHTIRKKLNAASQGGATFQNAQILASSSTSPQASILQELDLQDRALYQWSTLHTPETPMFGDSAPWFTTEHPDKKLAGVWLLYALHHGSHTSMHLEHFPPQTPAKPSPLTPWLHASLPLVEHPKPLLRLATPPRTTLLLSIQDSLQHRFDTLRTRALATPSCSLRSPQVKLWQQLLKEGPPAKNQALQSRLNRRYPSGIEAMLEKLLTLQLPPKELTHRLMTMLPEPQEPQKISIHLLGGLWVQSM